MSGTRSIASAGGAIVAAIASSACCWLPLLLMTFGLSVGSVSAWFEQYRLIFLIVAGVLLSLGFYSAYFAGRRCDPACGCDRRASRMKRVSRIMLWISAVFVIGFAAFPKYVGAFIGDNGASTIATGSDTVEFWIEGMTCEACAVHLQESLSGVPGVSGAQVSYADGLATLAITPDAPFNSQDALDAIVDAGYSGSVERERKPDDSP
ncbi:MAG: cation transporter [Phycisphaerales bacterium]|nr:cation transporter [Phycisphaerales bacterium]